MNSTWTNEQIRNKVCTYREKIFEKIEREDKNALWPGSKLEDIKNVIIITSSSRAGSSLLFDIMKKLPNIYSLSGESVPFFKLCGLSSDIFHSDEISADKYIDNNFISKLSRDMMSDLASYTNIETFKYEEQVFSDYVDDLALRFSIEWPLIDFDYDIFKNIVYKALDKNLNAFGKFVFNEFYVELLFLLRQEYRSINPFYYDISSSSLQKKFPNELVPTCPPNNRFVIEEPPFITIHPRRNIDQNDLKEKTLLLKDPVNSYRFKFIEKLFPKAVIKIIYLTRNAAASINGLYDGWLHRGFFSCNLSELFKSERIPAESLRITGYSDKYEWGKWWWNFDRPPKWENYIGEKLEEVCAFQWKANNDAILDYLKESKGCIYTLKYEDIISDKEMRIKRLRELAEFAGWNSGIDGIIDADNLSVIQATKAPRRARWIDRKELITPIINSPGIRDTSVKMGYTLNRIEEWI